MITNIITVSNDKTGFKEVFTETDKFIQYNDLVDKDAIHMSLLSEEVISMVASITGDFTADFWIEMNNGLCKIYLKAVSEMNFEKKDLIISIATSKKNEAAKGIMGKIKDFFSESTYPQKTVGNNVDLSASRYLLNTYGFTEMNDPSGLSFLWSMNQYSNDIRNMDENDNNDFDIEDAIFEYEKSIVANIADDVKVWVRNDLIKMEIEVDFNK